MSEDEKALQDAGELAFQTLLDILSDQDAKPELRAKISQAILERAWGEQKQPEKLEIVISAPADEWAE